MNENKKAKIWVYAVILFTSAFIVLLLTAYSQIKLNKNLSDYKSQVYSKESENKKVQQNFSSAQEMNQKLNDEIKKLQEENNLLKANISGMEAEKANIDEKNKARIAAEDSLANALNAYLNGNVIECAGLIDSIDSPSLEGKTLETYKALSVKAKADAGKNLFDEGYALYESSKYADAAAKLLLSHQYAPSEAFSDKCLFYLAYSELRLDNKVAAVDHMSKLIYSYPESKYLRSAKRFVEKYK